MSEATIELLRERLASLSPSEVVIADDSALHAGHAGARGGGHYSLKIVADIFSGRTTVARHRLVYDAAGDLMRDRIHALSINAIAPAELQAAASTPKRG